MDVSHLPANPYDEALNLFNSSARWLYESKTHGVIFYPTTSRIVCRHRDDLCMLVDYAQERKVRLVEWIPSLFDQGSLVD
jgi:hypothetical protein